MRIGFAGCLCLPLVAAKAGTQLSCGSRMSLRPLDSRLRGNERMGVDRNRSETNPCSRCSPDGAQRNPGCIGASISHSRIPLRSMRATTLSCVPGEAQHGARSAAWCAADPGPRFLAQEKPPGAKACRLGRALARPNNCTARLARIVSSFRSSPRKRGPRLSCVEAECPCDPWIPACAGMSGCGAACAGMSGWRSIAIDRRRTHAA
ncbi:MAG: hypothetical protein QOC56_1033 [Alphaproteobacteria bacterium]|jgi:hypothetical protein|nr:hypothetical protein [Alphaproteobacteria bacterium]